ncbi:MAG: hypothetical protein PHF35_02125 [Candidatus Moranbacteria bacterium]|nr:hypothetical protein [Candidatus Moranbacteria bacterium]
MKLFRILFVAVALLLSLVSLSEAKIYHFEIDGIPYASVDGKPAFEVTPEYHAKFKKQDVWKKVRPQYEPARKATPARMAAPPVIIPKAEAPAPVREMEVPIAKPQAARPASANYIGKGNNSRERCEIPNTPARVNSADQAPVCAAPYPNVPFTPGQRYQTAEPVKDRSFQANCFPTPAGRSGLNEGNNAPQARGYCADGSRGGADQAPICCAAPSAGYKAGVPGDGGSHQAQNSAEKGTYRYLADWDVMEITYEIDKNGKARPFKIYRRSLAETGTRYAPGYGPKSKPARTYTERRDVHNYIVLPGKPVPAGAVEHFALSSERKPSELEMKHMTGIETKTQYEIVDENGFFRMVDKPKALQVEYIDPVQKNYNIVPVTPSKELYAFTDSRRIPKSPKKS